MIHAIADKDTLLHNPPPSTLQKEAILLGTSALVNTSPCYCLVHTLANLLQCWSWIAPWYISYKKMKRTYCAQYNHISTDSDDTIMTACLVWGLRFRTMYWMKSSRCCQVGRTGVTVAEVMTILVGTATIALVVDLLQTPLRFFDLVTTMLYPWVAANRLRLFPSRSLEERWFQRERQVGVGAVPATGLSLSQALIRRVPDLARVFIRSFCRIVWVWGDSGTIMRSRRVFGKVLFLLLEGRTPQPLAKQLQQSSWRHPHTVVTIMYCTRKSFCIVICHCYYFRRVGMPVAKVGAAPSRGLY